MSTVFLAYLPWFAVMGLLVTASAFFSASESAALLPDAPGATAAGRRGIGRERIAVGLLDDPDRLLTAILFWNLLVNLTYFTLSSIGSLQMQRAGHTAEAGTFAAVSVLLLIIFGEMAPKTVGVMWATGLAPLLGMPLAGMIRLLAPLIPVFRWANLLSQRVLWPQFQAEPYLHLTDLERAVEHSYATADATLLIHEHTVLQGIVALSGLRVDELMRPRARCVSSGPRSPSPTWRPCRRPAATCWSASPTATRWPGRFAWPVCRRCPGKTWSG